MGLIGQHHFSPIWEICLGLNRQENQLNHIRDEFNPRINELYHEFLWYAQITSPTLDPPTMKR